MERPATPRSPMTRLLSWLIIGIVVIVALKLFGLALRLVLGLIPVLLIGGLVYWLLTRSQRRTPM